MEIKDSNLLIARNIIMDFFYFLNKEYNFLVNTKNKDSGVFIDGIEVEYLNQQRSRCVNISCVKGKVYDNVKYTFNATINRVPYSEVIDFFSLSNYLESIGKDFSTSIENKFDELEAKVIVSKIANAITENLIKVIDGSIWLEKYYSRKD